MKISIIIVSLNGAPRIHLPLEALRRCEPAPLEIIVVDNGSEDGLSEIVERDYPEVVLVRAPENLGFAGGNNLGIVNAGGDIVLLLNDDTEPEPDWLAPIAEAFHAQPKLGIVGCQLLYPGGEKVQHLGGVVHQNGLTDHTAWGEAADRAGEGLRLVPSEYVTGAAIAIRRRVLSEVGLLDPGFWPIYFEETDLCARVRRRGWEIAVALDSRVVHHESQTTGRMSRRFLLIYHRNRIRYLLKNRTILEWFGTVRAEVRWFVQHTPWDQLWPCAMAYAWAPVHLVDIWKERRMRRRHS